MSLKAKLHLFIKTARDQIWPTYQPTQFHHQAIPYFAQWESPKLVDDILAHTIKAKNDPKWQQSGATTMEEYEQWSWTACGMACLKMILAHRFHRTVPLVTLGKQCLKYGGYTLPLESSPGLYYRPFVEFVKKEYGLEARVVNGLTIREIQEALAQDKYVIASVNPGLRQPASKPPHKGGHLVLLIGYDQQKNCLYLHNPSGYYRKSQENFEISVPDFKKFFSHKGIIVW